MQINSSLFVTQIIREHIFTPKHSHHRHTKTKSENLPLFSVLLPPCAMDPPPAFGSPPSRPVPLLKLPSGAHAHRQPGHVALSECVLVGLPHPLRNGHGEWMGRNLLNHSPVDERVGFHFFSVACVDIFVPLCNSPLKTLPNTLGLSVPPESLFHKLLYPPPHHMEAGRTSGLSAPYC